MTEHTPYIDFENLPAPSDASLRPSRSRSANLRDETLLLFRANWHVLFRGLLAVWG